MASPQEEAGRELARLDQAIADLRPRIAQCRTSTGYEAISDAARGLAPGEREYRACLYRSVEEVILPAIRYEEVRGWYRELLAEDRMLTDAVGGGRMSRFERQVRLDTRREALARQYQAFLEKRIAEDRAEKLEAEKKRFEPNRQVMEIQDRLSVIQTIMLPR